VPISRRQAIAALAGTLPAFKAAAAHSPSQQFTGTRESLSPYRVPEWFREAKFGIWAHWGPQSSVEAGDWYARNMYIQGQRQYDYHVKTFGHPSKSGYKDLIPLWKGEKFDANHLVGLYKKAGAKYFMSMAVHHDNFDMWNSRHNRWNAANMGIKKDVVGCFRQAAANHGLKRPWKISGQRPLPKSTRPEDTAFNEKDRKDLTAEDFRFTTKGQTLYAFMMGWPGTQVIIPALGSTSSHVTGTIERVALLGSSNQLKFTRDTDALKIDLPDNAPSHYAVAFRLSGQNLV
jgi:alpha-L-fucosidase